ncbi:copper chaperone PCu(A)C [Kamptonema cortianum]|jgi:periplasmic copper chaperone A|nr:copper chaperone PCu(A)C [Oscillatoria laete-virens]MDK3159350.1 copper chaperone PCu(A)C [Kamptonema cortianum]MDL5054969.1 copper chaperone PCu(A)C [Oscillatoria laete-virens NRMC-F 0139]
MSVKQKPLWMRVIEALTLIFAIIAVLSPFAAILLPAVLQALTSNGQSDLSVSQAWVRPITVSTTDETMADMPMNDGVTAAYMIIINRGAADQLVSISTEAAETAELHQTQVDEAGIARMRPQPDGIAIPSNAETRIEPMGYHIMLSGLTRTLERDQEISMQLTFASGTVLNVTALVADYAPEALSP